MQLARAASIAPSAIRAIAELAEGYPDTLRLFFGEDTRPTPEFLKAAGKQALDANHTFYTPNAGYRSLRSAIADHLRRIHDLEIDPDRELLVTGSGMVALALACHALVGPGQSALVVTPLWPNVQAAVRMTGAEPIAVPLREAERYELDLDALERAVRPDTRMLVLASPGNPTGWTATEADWRVLVAFCERHDLWLVADTVYDRIVFDAPSAPGPLSVPGARARTVVVQSFSKAYRMTGWRIGYAVAPRPVARAMTDLQEFVVSHAPGFCQEAARVALIEGEPFIREAQERYRRHRDLARERLRGLPGLTLAEPTGAFYVFPRLDGLADSFAFCAWLVREHGVGLAPGSAFGEGGEGHVRLCFAVEEPVLLEALDRFERAWKQTLSEGLPARPQVAECGEI